MDWKKTDERLIRRGELILDLESLKNHVKELENMNEGRPGPRYKLANSYIQLLAAVRYARSYEKHLQGAPVPGQHPS